MESTLFSATRLNRPIIYHMCGGRHHYREGGREGEKEKSSDQEESPKDFVNGTIAATQAEIGSGNLGCGRPTGGKQITEGRCDLEQAWVRFQQHVP